MIDKINHSLDGYAPDFTTLPTASSQHVGRIVRHAGGGAGGRDRLVVVLKSAGGVYNWIEIVNGGA